MLCLFMRHGETNFNLAGLCNDDPAQPAFLTDRGRRQAQAAALALRHESIEHIFVSELPRTRQTAEIINRDHRAPITVQPLLNDIRSGFDGRPVAEYQAWIRDDPVGTRPPGGESLADHKARVLDYLDWLGRRPESTVLTIAHEETLRVVIAHFRHLSDEEMIPLAIGNAEVLRFDCR